jgi:catechol 2,3-dioxygenase-like lactoylglutathione lyase family enzyme
LYQLGRGNDPMIEVGNVTPADALYISLPFIVGCCRSLRSGPSFLDDHKEAPMTIVLDHTIVPARDKEESARFFARIFGLEYQGPVSHFAPVRINETLTIDFDNWENFERHHYAFKVSDAEFDGIFDRVRGEGLTYGSGPRAAENMEINHRNGGRGFYFRDPNGHLLEVLTA